MLGAHREVAELEGNRRTRRYFFDPGWPERERRLNADRASLIAVPDPEDVTGDWVEKVQSSIDAIQRNETN